jgi:hypothetical protein
MNIMKFKFARGCLTTAAAITILWMMMSLWELGGSGTFHADYYYLQIREFVPAENREAMERRIIELYDVAQARAAIVRLVVLGVQLILLLLARSRLTHLMVVKVVDKTP